MVFGVTPTLLGIALAILFALLPDIDGILLIIRRIKGEKSKAFGAEFKHHEYPTHFPIIYSPLIILAIVLPNIYTISIVTGIYLHLFLDSFYTSDGIKWLYPLKDKYYGSLSEGIKGKHGMFWQSEYMGTPFYKLEFVFLVISCLILWLNHIFYYIAPIWAIGLLGGVIICFFGVAYLFERGHVKYIRAKVSEETEKSNQ